jgi:hypothetical protein
MSVVESLPGPLELGTALAADMDRMHDFACRYGTTFMVNNTRRLEFSLRLYPDGSAALYPPDDSFVWPEAVDPEEARDIMLPLAEAGEGWLHPDAAMKLDFSIGTVRPQDTLRLPDWHVDGSPEQDLRSVMVSSDDPTEFAIGMLEGDLAVQVKKAKADIVTNPEVQNISAPVTEGLAKKQLSIVGAEILQVMGITENVVHRPQVNSREFTITKSFARLGTIRPRQKANS